MVLAQLKCPRGHCFLPCKPQGRQLSFCWVSTIKEFVDNEIQKVENLDTDEGRQQKILWDKFKEIFDPENEINKKNFQNEINQNFLVDVTDYDFSSKVVFIKYIMETNSFKKKFEEMNLEKKDKQLINYYLLSKIKNPGDYSDLETIYFNIEEKLDEPTEKSVIPPSGISIIDNRLSDYNFKKKLYKQMGYILIQNRDEKLQEYTFKNDLRVIKNARLDFDINNLFLYDEFTSKIDPQEVNKKVGYIISSLKKNGLYLIRQDKKTLLCNTDKITSSLVLPISSPNFKIDEKNYFDKITQNGGSNPPPILYNYEPTIKNKLELDEKINKLNSLIPNIKSREEECAVKKRAFALNINPGGQGESWECGEGLHKMRKEYTNLLEKLFVYKNYDFVKVTDKSGKDVWVGILKADVSLYHKTYEKFNIENFAKEIVKGINEKEEKIKSDRKLEQSKHKSYTGYLNQKGTELMEWWNSENYVKSYSYDYGYKFSYFDTLKIMGGLKKWQNNKNSFQDIVTVKDMPPELEEIIPISVVYRNLYSRVIGKDNIENKFDLNGNVVLSNGKNYVFRQDYPDQWIDVEKAKE
jgi:hypothetical protein